MRDPTTWIFENPATRTVILARQRVNGCVCIQALRCEAECEMASTSFATLLKRVDEGQILLTSVVDALTRHRLPAGEED